MAIFLATFVGGSYVFPQSGIEPKNAIINIKAVTENAIATPMLFERASKEALMHSLFTGPSFTFF